MNVKFRHVGGERWEIGLGKNRVAALTLDVYWCDRLDLILLKWSGTGKVPEPSLVNLRDNERFAVAANRVYAALSELCDQVGAAVGVWSAGIGQGSDD